MKIKACPLKYIKKTENPIDLGFSENCKLFNTLRHLGIRGCYVTSTEEQFFGIQLKEVLIKLTTHSISVKRKFYSRHNLILLFLKNNSQAFNSYISIMLIDSDHRTILSN